MSVKETYPGPKYYNVIKAINLDRLVTQVNEAIEEGWIPIGGISDGTSYLQALYKPRTPAYSGPK